MAKSHRETVLETIRAGRAAMLTVNGKARIFTLDNIDSLPSEADLALGNPEAEAVALTDIDEQIRVLEAAKKKLQKNSKDEAKAVKAQAEEQEEAREARKAETKEEAPKASTKKEENK